MSRFFTISEAFATFERKGILVWGRLISGIMLSLTGLACQGSAELDEVGQSQTGELGASETALQEYVTKFKETWLDNIQIPRPKAEFDALYQEEVEELIETYRANITPFIDRRIATPTDNTCEAVAWSWPDLTSERSFAIWEYEGDKGIIWNNIARLWKRASSVDQSLPEELLAPFNDQSQMRSYYRAEHLQLECSGPNDTGYAVQKLLKQQMKDVCPSGYCDFEISLPNCLCQTDLRLAKAKRKALQFEPGPMLHYFSDLDDSDIEQRLSTYLLEAYEIVTDQPPTAGTCSAAHIQTPDMLSEASYRIRHRNGEVGVGINHWEIRDNSGWLSNTTTNLLKTTMLTEECQGQYDDGQHVGLKLRENTTCEEGFCLHEYTEPVCNCGPSEPSDAEINAEYTKALQKFVSSLPVEPILKRDWSTISSWRWEQNNIMFPLRHAHNRRERGSCKLWYETRPFPFMLSSRHDAAREWMSVPENTLSLFSGRFLREQCEGPGDIGDSLVTEAKEITADCTLASHKQCIAHVSVPVCDCEDLY